MHLFHGVLAPAHLKEQQEVDSLITQLASVGYLPALRTSIESLIKVAGISGSSGSSPTRTRILLGMMSDQPYYPSDIERRAAVGDLFFLEDSALLLQPAGQQLAICEIRPHHRPEHLQAFAEKVSEAARVTLDGRRLRAMSFEWTEMSTEFVTTYARQQSYGKRRVTRQRRELLNTQPATLTADNVEDARLLLDPERRLFLQRLTQVAKARSVDARQDANGSIVDPLLSRGLVRKEFLVLCRKDSTTLCTVESKSELDHAKIRCSNCGRPFSEEQIQEIYAPASQSKQMLDGSHWMTIWITDLLAKAGVDSSEVDWGATAGEDEVDIVANINGVKVFFELKDREFGLGDAYPFSSRVQRYGADFGIIVSMDKVADEVKKYLEEQRGTRIYTLAGEKEISKLLPRVIEVIAMNASMASFSDIFTGSHIDLRPLLELWAARPASPSPSQVTVTSPAVSTSASAPRLAPVTE